jgi:GST-like protein
MSAWGWLERAPRVLATPEDPLAPLPHLKRWFAHIDTRPAAARARAIQERHAFNMVHDE